MRISAGGCMEKNKPILSIVQFKGEENHNIGAAWPRDGKDSLRLSLNLKLLGEEAATIRLKAFPNDFNDRAFVLDGYLGQVLEKIKASKTGEKKPERAPLMDAVIKHEEKWINIGCFWNNSNNGNLDFQLKLKDIPEELKTENFSALIFPNKRYFAHEGSEVDAHSSGGES